MQERITDGLRGAFESVLESRNAYYQANPDKIPVRRDVQALIRSAVTQNAAISGSAGLIPGPFGMLAVVPELLLVIRNQIALIYDIGAAYGQKEIMTRELLLGVFVSAAGTSTGSLLVIRGGQVLVRRASLRVLTKVIAMLGGKITQQALKSAISKWLPGVGAAAMAAWTGYLTNQIGKMAMEIFQKDIVNDPDTPDIELIKPIETAPNGIADGDLEFSKLQVLIELAKIDGSVSEQEREFINQILGSPDLSDAHRALLLEFLEGKSQPLQGIEKVAAQPDSAVALLANMVALARRDEIHITEKIYIRRIGSLLGFAADEIEELLAAE
ncbi:TerB family tellurite resistance protein [Luteimonas sp. A534]